jgi:glycerol-3-phosphate dehydrogenase
MSQSAAPRLTERRALLAALKRGERYDLAIVGGGATGLGLALDAAARGYRVALVEAYDFAKGTSSRATKLLHGGVRYLAQGDISLVREALHERTTLLRNAPHLAQPLPFVLPSYRWWETPFYGIGLKLYDALAGSAGLGKTEFLNAAETLQQLPMVKSTGLRGGVRYWDGQFNDARLALALARTAAAQGADLINYCRAESLSYEAARITGLNCRDVESGETLALQAACVVNATGVWVDGLRMKDQEVSAQGRAKPFTALVAPSQGVHLVVDREFLGGNQALMVPKTRDGRVLFAVPWLGKLILGTTDTPRDDLSHEPLAFTAEVDFILEEAGRYLRRAPQRSDIKSVWVGLRPLVQPPDEERGNTKGLSREHTILISASGLVTVTGGKWTTYRAMAEDVLERCFERNLLRRTPAGATTMLSLLGAEVGAGVPVHSISAAEGLHSYGSEAKSVQGLPGAQRQICEGLSEAMVRFAARFEFARCVEDVLARRSRLLFLDAQRALSVAPQVSAILWEENRIDPRLEQFEVLARRYLAPA